jgi:hypothetical protein
MMRGKMHAMATEQIPRPDRRLRRPRSLPRWQRDRRRVGYVLAGIVLAVYSWFLGGLAPFSLNSLVGVLIPGAVMGVLAYGWPPPRIPAPERLDVAGMSYWIIAVGVLFEWEASAFKDNSLWWHPSLTDLVDPLIGPHPLKSVAVLLWLLTGWGLVRR